MPLCHIHKLRPLPFVGFLIAALLAGQASSKVLVLTDANFDQAIAESDKDFLIDIYAPWCSHCRLLEPVWEQIAHDLEGQVNVAKVDATENDALRARFFVMAYPTIVHLHDGKTRPYKGSRERSQLVRFALEDWSETDPVAFYLAPNSSFGKALGVILGFPSRVVRMYGYMNKSLHMPQLAIILVFLTFPIALGVASICLLDYMHTRSALAGRHEHQQ